METSDKTFYKKNLHNGPIKKNTPKKGEYEMRGYKQL